MDRFKPVDCTNSTLGAVLYPDEEVITLQPSVGLYQGKDKVKDHQQGTLYLTSHRLIYIDDHDPHRTSCYLDLEKVTSSEYYAGFLKSSPKVTLGLHPASEQDAATGSSTTQSELRVSAPSSSTAVHDWRIDSTPHDVGAGDAPASWICTVCGYSNAPAQGKCDLCGVRRDTSSSNSSASTTKNGSSMSISKLKDSPQGGPSTDSYASQPKPIKGAGIACPTCTFSNHPSMVRCELCDSPLNTAASLMSHSSGDSKSVRGSPSVANDLSNVNTPNLGTSPALSIHTPSRPVTPGPPPDSVKLSFRQGGDKAFYGLIKSTLLDKAWKKLPLKSTPTGSSRLASNVDGRDYLRRAGIDSILSSVDTGARAQKDDMTDALKDLEALMAKAKQMVDLAESLNSKLSRQEAQSNSNSHSSDSAGAGTDSEAATLIRTSLVQLGLAAPAVTADMADSDSTYHFELARELAGVLLGSGPGQGGLMGKGALLKKGEVRKEPEEETRAGRGLVGLDEAWCVWNRARGVALIPPKSLLRAAAHLPTMTYPTIRLRTFRSGLSVLHTPRYDASRFGDRLVRSLQVEEARARRDVSAKDKEADHNVSMDDLLSDLSTTTLEPLPPFGSGLTTLELSTIEQAPILLVQEMVEEAEMKGLVCRDEGPGGVRWFVNHFVAAAGQ